jgi:hypothetical protein
MPLVLKPTNQDPTELLETERSLSGFLKSDIEIDGAYTALRTAGERRWIKPFYHCKRIWENAKRIDMIYAENKSLAQCTIERDEEMFLSFVESTFQLLDRSLEHPTFAKTKGDLKAILFLVPTAFKRIKDSAPNVVRRIPGLHGHALYAYFDFIQDDFNSRIPINVLIFGSPRKNPTCKDTRWIRDRKYITDRKPADVSEMILHQGNDLYEGTVSNFWVLKRRDSDDSFPGNCFLDSCILQTAPFEAVLDGSVSRDIVESAQSLNISIEFAHPSILDFKNWIGCFITSTYLLISIYA